MDKIGQNWTTWTKLDKIDKIGQNRQFGHIEQNGHNWAKWT